MPERSAGGLDMQALIPRTLQDDGLAGHFNFRFLILDLRLSMLCNESLTSVWLLSRLRR
jgi:hypothetical protein